MRGAMAGAACCCWGLWMGAGYLGAGALGWGPRTTPEGSCTTCMGLTPADAPCCWPKAAAKWACIAFCCADPDVTEGILPACGGTGDGQNSCPEGWAPAAPAAAVRSRDLKVGWKLRKAVSDWEPNTEAKGCCWEAW
uniref:Putative secreted protein n=1 Tax=Ixodes ricinus TaxID=34613 RepID=A0A6B0USH8_IXORI